MKNFEDNKFIATFAGGCFWCMEPVFRIYKGVIDASVGYVGPGEQKPTYEQVASGTTNFKEGIQVTYDPSKIEYEFLVKIFLHNIDPTDAGGQFFDRGAQYQTAIYYHTPEQKNIAETQISKLESEKKFSAPLVIQILPYPGFFPAEEYHQGYYKKNPIRYQMYHEGSGRPDFIARFWGEDSHKA